MSELLKIHANGQWELTKAKALTPEEAVAFKARREAWLREKHGMKPATEQDHKMPDRPKIGSTPIYHGSTHIDRSQHAERARAEIEAKDKKELREKLKDKPVVKRPDAQKPMTEAQIQEHKRKFSGNPDIQSFREPLSPKKK